MTRPMCVAGCVPSVARHLAARPPAVGLRLPRLPAPARGPSARSVHSFRHRAVKKEVDAEASSEDEQAVDTSSKVQAEVAEEAEDKPKFTQEEIAAMAAERRAAKAEAASSSNFVSGALEEAQLIVWPSLQEAVINTFIVIAMVFISAAMLFGVNTGLAALSNKVYGSSPTPQAASEGPAASAAATAPVQAEASKLAAPAPASNVPLSLGSD